MRLYIIVGIVVGIGFCPVVSQTPLDVVWFKGLESSGGSGLTISPDGTVAYTATNRALEAWRISDGERIFMADSDDVGELGHFTSLTLSNDGSVLASTHFSVSYDGGGEETYGRRHISIWRAEDGTLLQRLEPVPAYTSLGPASFSHNGDRLAVIVYKDVSIFDSESLEEVFTFSPDQVAIGILHLPTEEDVLVTFGGGLSAPEYGFSAARFWEGESGTLLGSYPHSEYCEDPPPYATYCGGGASDLAISQDGSMLATSGNGTWDGPLIKVWDLESGELLHRFPGWIVDYGPPAFNRIAFSPAGDYLAVATHHFTSNGLVSRIRFWDLGTGEIAREYSTPDIIRDIAFPSDSQHEFLLNVRVLDLNGRIVLAQSDLEFSPHEHPEPPDDPDPPEQPVQSFEISVPAPNPSSYFVSFTIDVPEVGRVVIRVVDVLGRIVHHGVEGMQDAGTMEHQIDTSKLPPGSYFLEATLNGRQATGRRFVVVR